MYLVLKDDDRRMAKKGLYVGIKHLKIERSQMEAEIDKVVTTKKARLAKIVSEVTAEVTDAIAKKDFDMLNGKLITGELAQEFGLEREILNRTIADKLRQGNAVPAALTKLLQQMTTSIPLSLT